MTFQKFTNLLLTLATMTAAARADEKDDLDFFEKKIRSLLVDHCYKCHSDKAEKLEGGLYVDTRDGLLKGGDQGPAIEPGEPERSLLLKAVKYEMDDLKMPPDKRLDDAQIADLAEWIKRGAPDPRKPSDGKQPVRVKLDVETARQTWPFRPLEAPTVPAVRDPTWPRGAIDQFLLTEMERRRLRPSAPADKHVLIRRVTFDLLGLPPTPDEIAEFVGEDRPDGFARLVDRLLASPRYGERWGRHWMDVVRYADTAGDNSDYPIPQMHKYRNWIIRAFNTDMPYNEFVRQQLAGDLLPATSTDDRHDKLIATGYIANARRFGSRVDDYPQHLTIEDTIDNFGRTFLGLTINCARCHDHKFDPVSNEDYYGLYGFFHSTRYPWPGIELEKRQRDFVPLASDEVVQAERAARRTREAELKTRVQELEREKAESDKLVGDDAKARREAAKKAVEAAKRDLDRLRAEPLAYETAYAVVDASKIEDVAVQIKGDPERLGGKVRRRFPLVLGGAELSDDDTTSGRVALANWLVDPRNPLTARVMMNRLWHYHFGRGIVATPSDFGKQGRPPTHPELLDWLARQFVDGEWSLKLAHRAIVLSAAYQQASSNDESTDAENLWLARYSRRRLDAESIRDALLAIAGNLDFSAAGPHPFPKQTDWDFTQHKPFRAVYESQHRSLYLMTQRIQRHPYLAIFDGADTSASTAARVTSTTTLQSLYLLNGALVHEQAGRIAARLLASEPDVARRSYPARAGLNVSDPAENISFSSEQVIKSAFRLLFGREVVESESRQCLDYLAQSRATLSSTTSPAEQEQAAWQSLVRALLRLNEFVYVA